jgi:hypothetical protein
MYLSASTDAATSRNILTLAVNRTPVVQPTIGNCILRGIPVSERWNRKIPNIPVLD